MTEKFTIAQYKFDSSVEGLISQNHRNYLSWPLVYFLNDTEKKDAYVGETTDVLKRLKAHANSNNKKDLTTVNLILSEYFNKSATLDI